MYIRSKWKDYYDYLQGIYGVDEKIVYERNAGGTNPLYVPDYIKIPNTEKPVFNVLYICGTTYCVYYYKNNFYFGDTLYIDEMFYDKGFEQRDMTPEKWNKRYHWSSNKPIHLEPTSINKKENCPILLSRNYMGNIRNIRLLDFGINKIISAHDIYLKISDFLSKTDETVDTRNNKEKILSHGFDYKSSFRNIK